MFWNQYPYINLNDLNLDFLLKAIGEMQNEVKNFVTLNAVKYADPIQWDITSQYEKNTIVIDPLTGTAYISVQPVPSGVALNRTDYWTPVFDLSRFITQGNENLTEHVEGAGIVYSTFALNAGDWVIWNGVLYKALVNMPIGTAYSVDGNIERVTVEDYIKSILTAIANEVQARIDADTTLQTNIDNEAIARTNAINNLKDYVDNKPYLNANSFGADASGVEDSTDAINDTETLSNNSLIIFKKGVYKINNEPDASNCEYDFSFSKFEGAGAGDPSSYAGKFSSPLNNPGLYAVSKYQKADINDFECPIGNGVTLEAHEIDNRNAVDYINVIGTINNGSSVLTVDDATGIERGDGVLLMSPVDPAWLDGSTRANTIRVVSVVGNSVTIGADNSNGNGNAVAQPWTGSTITNGTFKIRKRRWQVVDFKGVTSPNASNPDRLSWVRNDILEINGNSGNCYELEVNAIGNGNEISRGVFVTGRGAGVAPMAAIDIQRADYEPTNNWLYGIGINSAANGIMISASKGIIINTHWNDRATQTVQELYVGIEFDNIDNAVRGVRPLFAGKTITNGASAIVLERSEDATPTGYYIQCMNSDATDNIFTVDTNGTVYAGIYKMRQFVNVDSTITIKGYVIMQDANGDPIKVMVAN